MKRIVLKIGTRLLVKQAGAEEQSRANDRGAEKLSIDRESVSAIVKQIAGLKNSGNEVILVSSGAIACGAGFLDIRKTKIKNLMEKQACSAIGQPILMKVYSESFEKYNVPVAQLLLTRDDFEDRGRYINIRNTILTLLNKGVVPVINENDTVSTEEIRFGDNDMLAALVAIKSEADLLVILTDVEGLCSSDPRTGKNAECIRCVTDIDGIMEKVAIKRAECDISTGGMFSKVQAAKIATAAGIETIITDGRNPDNISEAVSGRQIGTRFVPSETVMESRKKWLAYGAKAGGKICIDDGAVGAIVRNGKSLLASGITSVEGNFDMGDVVRITDASGRDVARGLTHFSSSEIEKIKGRKSSEIVEILGKCDFDEVVHRDNLVVLWK
ncbi:MAG: glutamate 5-kinase [Elusimicrobia bacterium]|nr:glutamate 5-kinase [Elusimicrobiota bacterium]